MASPTIDPAHAPRVGASPTKTENTKVRNSALCTEPAGAGWLKFSSRGADLQYSHRTGSDPVLLLAVIFGATRRKPFYLCCLLCAPADFKPPMRRRNVFE
jgi:hypothetical protein